jgi:hypothetical protein
MVCVPAKNSHPNQSAGKTIAHPPRNRFQGSVHNPIKSSGKASHSPHLDGHDSDRISSAPDGALVLSSIMTGSPNLIIAMKKNSPAATAKYSAAG